MSVCHHCVCSPPSPPATFPSSLHQSPLSPALHNTSIHPLIYPFIFRTLHPYDSRPTFVPLSIPPFLFSILSLMHPSLSSTPPSISLSPAPSLFPLYLRRESSNGSLCAKLAWPTQSFFSFLSLPFYQVVFN